VSFRTNMNESTFSRDYSGILFFRFPVFLLS